MDTRYTRRRAGKLLQRTRSRAAKRKEQPSLFSHAHRGERLARQREGIEAKKARGEYKGRQPIAVDASQFEQEYRLWRSGQITAVTAMSHLGLKPNTFYRRVKEYEANEIGSTNS